MPLVSKGFTAIGVPRRPSPQHGYRSLYVCVRARARAAGRRRGRSTSSAPGRSGTIPPRPALVFPLITEIIMTKSVPPVPEDNQSHKGPGSAPDVPLDTTKGHRDDEKNNIREQAEHGNMTQNTSNRRSG